MVRLLSYNILFGKKLPRITSWIHHEHTHDKPFDIMCFQEFPERAISSFIRSLKICTPNIFSHALFAPAIYKGHQVFGQLTLFNHKKLALSSSKTLFLGTSKIERYVFKLWRTRTKRNSLIAHFHALTRKRAFTVVNTHLTTLAFNTHRINQLTRILAELNGQNSSLIVGDFNYTSLIRLGRLIRFMKMHLFENASHRLRTHRLFYIPQQLDYIFTRGLHVKTVRTQRLTFSDHYPLMASIEL